MQHEQAPDAAGQLQLIHAMINRARNQFSENGHMYLVWGWTILVCSIASFVMEHIIQWPQAYYVWIIPWLTFIYQFFYLAKHRRERARVVTYTGELVKNVWLVFIMLMVLTLAIINRYHPGSEEVNPLILVVYGMPTFLIGKILKFKPLVVGAISCWALAVLCLFIPLQYHILLVAAGVAIAWIVPGYLFKSRFNSEA